MGVQGLWKLIEPSGQMVPLESLAGKVLAVDVSIWLHQAIKGMHDAQGAPVSVAHLLILFHRLCKLLFYKIKPVFVFDGGVPALKHQTMVARRQQSNVAKSEALKVREKLIKNLLKHQAVRQILQSETASAALGLNSFTLPGPSIEEDLYKLPPVAAEYVDSECSEDVTSSEEEEHHTEDIHSVDVTSKEFLSLPPEVRHDILTDLIETRKQSSWKNLDSMPKESDSFSNFQMERLLKRHAVQTTLEKTGKEMGGRALSLKELEALLGDQGVLDVKMDLPGKRIAQDSVTHYMLVQNSENNASTEAAEIKFNLKEIETAKKFDIMNHLEDIDWSSKSDNETLLDKQISKENETELSKKTLAHGSQGISENTCSTTVFSIEKKRRMADEISSILTILEDNDDVTKNMQTQIGSSQNQTLPHDDCNKMAEITTEEQMENIRSQIIEDKSNLIISDEEGINMLVQSSRETERAETSSEAFSEHTIPLNSSESNISKEEGINTSVKSSPQTEKGETSSKPHFEPTIPLNYSESNISKEEEINTSVKSSQKTEKEETSSKPTHSEPIIALNSSEFDISKETFLTKNDECEDFWNSKEIKNKNYVNTPLIEETIKPDDVKSSNSIEKVDDFSSSSDSESDLIPITPETDSFLNSSDGNVIKSLSDIEEKSNKGLTVTVNPLKTNDNDDLFADIFQSVPRQSIKKTCDVQEENINHKSDIGETRDDDMELKKSECESLFETEKHALKEDLNEIQKVLEVTKNDLIAEQGKQERLALNLSDQMYSDAQELLKLFGIPFVIAPMEAEAQCATLNMIGLTDGTITDDSDIWLFGGKVVYKNFFNQKKHVLEYRSENIQKYFKLSREDLIKMAMLVGSDYTVGLNGIGPVTALEILASFQTSNKNDLLESLRKFCDWFTGKNKNGPPRTSLKKKIRNTIVSPGFPNRAVVEAYLHPLVDDSKEPFSWAQPNVDLIRKYAKMKMGWSPEKCNELLLPVLRKLQEDTSQTVLEKYFKTAEKPLEVGLMSKRVKKAIMQLENESIEEMEQGPVQKKPRKSRKGEGRKDCEGTRRASSSKRNVKIIDNPSSETLIDNKSSDISKTLLINERLHQETKIPQKELTQKMLQKRKKEAIEIFRTYKKGGKKKVKVFAKEDANLSESSSGEN